MGESCNLDSPLCLSPHLQIFRRLGCAGGWINCIYGCALTQRVQGCNSRNNNQVFFFSKSSISCAYKAKLTIIVLLLSLCWKIPDSELAAFPHYPVPAQQRLAQWGCGTPTKPRLQKRAPNLKCSCKPRRENKYEITSKTLWVALLSRLLKSSPQLIPFRGLCSTHLPSCRSQPGAHGDMMLSSTELLFTTIAAQ